MSFRQLHHLLLILWVSLIYFLIGNYTRETEQNHFDIFFTASYASFDLVESFNSHEWTISSLVLVTFVISASNKNAGWGASIASLLPSIARPYTLILWMLPSKLLSINSHDPCLVRQTDLRNSPLCFSGLVIAAALAIYYGISSLSLHFLTFC